MTNAKRFRGWFTILTLLEIVVGVVACGGVLIAQANFAPCGEGLANNCVYEVGSSVLVGMPIAAVIVFAVTTAVGVFRTPTIKTRIIAPVVGTGVLVALFLLSLAAIHIAVR